MDQHADTAARGVEEAAVGDDQVRFASMNHGGTGKG